MNLDLLKKLTRLANNNPNDNEANLAARKVCRMLEECSFTLNNGNSTQQAPPNFRTTTNPQSTSYDWFSEMFRGYKPHARQGEWYEGSWDIPKDRTEEYKRAEQKHYQNKPSWWDEPQQTGPKKEKRTLTCTLCKKKQETVFAGHESVFECNNCQWTAYTRTKSK